MGGFALTSHKRFQHQLSTLFERLLQMGELVEQAVLASTASLVHLDGVQARRVIRDDTHVDIMETEIEDRAVFLLSLGQAVPHELRLITTISKVVTDLERIADNAVNIAEITLQLEGQHLIKPLVDIPKMAAISGEMVHESLKTLIDRDAVTARLVAARDDEVDHMYKSVSDELMQLANQPRSKLFRQQCVHLMFVARYL